MTRRALGLGLKHTAQVINTGRLALGPRKSDHIDVARGMTVGGIGKQPQRAADIVYQYTGDIHVVIDCGNICDRAGLDGLQQVFALERGPLANEQRAVAHVA